jgi:hypothetical protein
VAVLLGAVLGCAREDPAGPEPACDAPRGSGDGAGASVVIVLNDVMRRDWMALDGGPAHQPTLETFASDHLVFERAFTAAPWTKPSVASQWGRGAGCILGA